MNSNLFYVGLKGVFCFSPPFPKLCETITVTSPSSPILPPPSSPSETVVGVAVFGGGAQASYTVLSIKNPKTLGLIANTNPGLSATSVYTYASNTTANGGTLSYIALNLAAAGNSTIGVFGAGINGIHGYLLLSTTSVYTYTSNTAVAGSIFSETEGGCAAVGNSVLGVFGGGYPPGGCVVSVYLYASNVINNGGVLADSQNKVAAVGNSIQGVFGGGSTGANASVSLTSIYIYASNNSNSGTLLNNTGLVQAAAGNSTLGVFVSESSSYDVASNTSIYLYSNNSVSAGSYIQPERRNQTGTGNSTLGVFGGGATGSERNPSSVTVQYAYSSNVVTQGANLTYSTYSLAAASNTNSGVNT